MNQSAHKVFGNRANLELLERSGLLGYIFFPFLLVLVVCVCLSVYQHSVITTAKENAYRVLENSGKEQVAILSAKIDNQYTLLKTFAVVAQGVYPEWAIREQMKIITDFSDFLHLFITDANGNADNFYGLTTNIFDRRYFQESMAGRQCLQRIDLGRLEKEPRFIMSVPMLREGKSIGVLYGSYNESLFRKLVAGRAFGEQSYAFVTDHSGNVIVGSDNKAYLLHNGNLFDQLSSSGNDVQQLKQDLEQSRNGVLTYTIGGKTRYASYSPIPYNNWMLFSVVPTNVIEEQAAVIIRSGWLLFAIVFIVSLVFLVLVIRLAQRDIQRIATEQKRAALDAERLRIAIETTQISLWDYDLLTHSIIQTAGSIKKHGFVERVENVPEALITSGYVHPSSAKEFLALYDKLFAGETYVQGVFQLQTVDRSGWWFEHIRYTTLFDESGKPYRAIGTGTDVTEEYTAKQNYERELFLQQLIDPNGIATALLNITDKKLERVHYRDTILAQSEETETFESFCQKAADCVVEDKDIQMFFRTLSMASLENRLALGENLIEFEYLFRTKDGKKRRVRTVCRLMQEPVYKKIMAFFYTKDIQDEHSKLCALSDAAQRDSMTSLYNHKATLGYMEDYLQTGGASGTHALFMIDIDNFKIANDVLGHQSGDKILTRCAIVLRNVFRNSDIVGRIGGDEFLVLMKNVTREQVETKAVQLQRALSFDCTHSEKKVSISASLGICICKGGESIASVYSKADSALYQVKEDQKNGYSIVTTNA